MPKRLNFNADTPASAQRMSRSRQHSGGDPTTASDSGFASMGAGGWTANRGIRKAPMSTARPTFGGGKGVRYHNLGYMMGVTYDDISVFNMRVLIEIIAQAVCKQRLSYFVQTA